MRDGRAMFIKGHARSIGFSARACAFLLVTVLSPRPSEVRAEVATKVTARGGVVADEPKEFSWVMAVGSERTLPKGSWTVDEGTSIVELGPVSKPAKLSASGSTPRPGVAGDSTCVMQKVVPRGSLTSR